MPVSQADIILIRHLRCLPADLRGAVVALGNFDGVHRGHQALIETARAQARARAAPLLVVTFEPHPRQYFRPQEPPFRLTTWRDKRPLLQALGADAMLVLRFDAQLAQLDAEKFIDHVLINALDACCVVIGHDFAFGRGRTGNSALLAQCLGQRLGQRVNLIAIDSQTNAAGEIYSSTAIREALIAGQPAEAAAMLGRDFRITGRVRAGDRRGRQLGYPTANLPLDAYIRPARGVYAVRVTVRGDKGLAQHSGVANLGHRPTVGGLEDRLETHIFDYNGELHGTRLAVDLLGFLRPEHRFASLDALKAQIALDCEEARAILKSRGF